MDKILGQILKSLLTETVVKEFLEHVKVALIAELKAQAAKTTTKLDDEAIETLAKALNAKI